MENLAELVGKWREAYESRKELEKLAEQIKKGPEAEAESAILTQLRLTGQDAIRLADGGGTIARRVGDQVRLLDAIAVTSLMYQRMREAEAEGRPLIDELLTERKASQRRVLDLADKTLRDAGRPVDFNSRNEVLATMGFQLVETESLSFTKSKK